MAYFVAHGYTFVAPADVLRGLDPAGKYALLTFDDGYYNNRLARQPACFYYAKPRPIPHRAPQPVMPFAWRRAPGRLDEQLALAHLAAGPERPALLVFMFHVLFEDEAAMDQHEVDSHQRITVRGFDQFVAYFVAPGYAFVAPADTLRGTGSAGKYARSPSPMVIKTPVGRSQSMRV